MKGGRKGTGMVIRELYIKNFGKFTERHFLSGGWRAGHIRGRMNLGNPPFMLLSVPCFSVWNGGRGRAAAKDAFTRCEPWENPGYYAGVMRFTCGGA